MLEAFEQSCDRPGLDKRLHEIDPKELKPIVFFDSPGLTSKPTVITQNLLLKLVKPSRNQRAIAGKDRHGTRGRNRGSGRTSDRLARVVIFAS